MSSLSVIVVDVEKFFKGSGSDLEKFGVAFAKLFKKAPSALQAIDNFVAEVAPVLTAAVALADPVAEPVVAAALATIETGLAGIEAAATAAVSGGSLAQDLQAFAADVPQLLTSIAVKNPALKSLVEKVVALVAGECKVLVPAVQSWVAQIKAATTPAAVVTGVQVSAQSA